MLGNKKCSQDTHAVQKSGLGTGWRRLFGGKYYKQRQNGVGLTNAKSQSPGAGASVTARLRGPGHYLPGRTVDFSWLYSKRIPGSHLVLTNVCFCNTFIYLPKTLIFFLYNKTMTKLSQQTQLIPHPISCYLIRTLSDLHTLWPQCSASLWSHVPAWSPSMGSGSPDKLDGSQFRMEGSSSWTKTSRTVGI